MQFAKAFFSAMTALSATVPPLAATAMCAASSCWWGTLVSGAFLFGASAAAWAVACGLGEGL